MLWHRLHLRSFKCGIYRVLKNIQITTWNNRSTTPRSYGIRMCSTWIQPQGRNTGIKIFNTQTKRKEDLYCSSSNKPITWYMCGPTVYDQAHLGHASTYVRFDIIRRILEDIFHLDTILVMGITDIDDKIISRAKEKNIDMSELSEGYEREFFRDMCLLGVKPPSVTVRVTDFIPHIIKFIQQIVDNGFAYATPTGSVYFDLERYTSTHAHGLLRNVAANTNQHSQMDMETGLEEKRNVRDFALWKGAKPGEPWWASPWGNGRPGWHIECSVMAKHILGEKLDIHSGGIDLVFPHHENEIAQCTACFNEPQWVNYWMHTGHLFPRNSSEKMSKSAKNYVSISEHLEQYTADHFRVFCLLRHYTSRIEYDSDSMSAAVSRHRGVCEFLHRSHCYVSGHATMHLTPWTRDLPTHEYLINVLQDVKHEVLEALRDDFDTPRVMNQLQYLINTCNALILDLSGGSNAPSEVTGQCRGSASVGAIRQYIINILALLGVNTGAPQELGAASSKERALLHAVLESGVQFRNEVRVHALAQPSSGPSSPLLPACDRFRNQLLLAGVKIQDRGKQSTWNISEDEKQSPATTAATSHSPTRATGGR